MNDHNNDKISLDIQEVMMQRPYDDRSPYWHIKMERIKQDAQWDEQDHTDAEWLAIITEEIGEVAECICHTTINPKGDLHTEQYEELMDYEIIQVAAVAVAWFETRRRRRLQ